MTASRARRAQACLLSTLTSAFLLGSGSLSAQSTSESAASAAGQPGPQSALKTAVQRELETLYHRDHRELPEYMKDDETATEDAAQTKPTPQRQPSVPAGTSTRPTTARTNSAAPRTAAAQSRPASDGKQTPLRQQISDYYASEGKSMPRVQNAGENLGAGTRSPAYQQTAGFNDRSYDSSSSPPPSDDSASPRKPRLIDRLNPFRRFSSHDEPQNEAHPPAARRQPTAQQPPRRQPSADRDVAPQETDSLRMYRAQHPSPGGRNTAPRPTAAMNTDRPAKAEAKPEFDDADAAQPAATRTSAPTTSGTTSTPVSQKPANDPFNFDAGDGPSTGGPANKVQPSPSEPKKAPAKTTESNDDFPNPFGEVSEKEADKKEEDPFTGLILEAEQKAAQQANPPAETRTPAAADQKAAAKKVAPAEEPNPFTVPETNAKPAVPKATVPRATVQESAAQESAVPKPALAKPAVQEPTFAEPADAKPAVRETNTKPALQQPPAESATAPRRFAQPSREQRLVEDEAIEADAKMRKIGERIGEAGFKSFCPVALRDRRDLVDANPRFRSLHNGKEYAFSTAEAKAAFDRSPEKYAPASDGIDLVVKANSDQAIEGSLDFAVWYKDRLYFFNSPESLETFSLSPSHYAKPR